MPPSVHSPLCRLWIEIITLFSSLTHRLRSDLHSWLSASSALRESIGYVRVRSTKAAFAGDSPLLRSCGDRGLGRISTGFERFTLFHVRRAATPLSRPSMFGLL